MISNWELVHYVQNFLSSADYTDYAPNGMQVEGKPSIKRICTAVTASEYAISQAIALGADALLVHHGYFWKGEDPTIQGMKGRRIRKLIQHDLNLFAFHLPLDCHPELGNNACLAKIFSMKDVAMHAVGGVKQLLWSGTLPKAMTGEELGQLVATQLGRTPTHIIGHNRPIVSMAWCSGAAQGYIDAAKHLGVDAYLSGEISEYTYFQAKELGIHYYGAGHNATERYGIKALGEHLGQQFQLEHHFIDSNNPV